jgi:hypothetical protein
MIAINMFLVKLSTFFANVIRSTCKFVLHWMSSTGEIIRICSSTNGCHSAAMTSSFATSLRKSKQLSTYNKIIFYPKVFSVNAALENILEVKKTTNRPNSITIANISHCLGSLRSVNCIQAKFDSLRKEPFDSLNPKHVVLLEKLWENMMPGIHREGGLVSSEWSALGFQGKDPASDFRGMGMLGLVQLVYFSENRSTAARDLLLESNHPRRWFPFAATGINMTKFVSELLAETRLHRAIFTHLENNTLTDLSRVGDTHASECDSLMAACEPVHAIYCLLFEDFHRLWVRRDPRDVMSFAVIFEELKAEYRQRYDEV